MKNKKEKKSKSIPKQKKISFNKSYTDSPIGIITRSWDPRMAELLEEKKSEHSKVIKIVLFALIAIDGHHAVLA